MPKGIYIKTEEHKKKISEAQKGNHYALGSKCTKEMKEKMSFNHADVNGENNPMFGKHHSKKTKKKMSEIGKCKIFSKETKEKLSKALKGRIMTKSWRENMSKARKGIKFSDETKRKISKIQQNRTKEWKNKIAQSLANFWKENLSSIEIAIHKVLDKLEIKYKIQVPFCYGKFIVDIYVPDKNLIIECNGDYWHNLPNRIKRDNSLQRYCDKWGIKLIWLWEKEIRENPELALKNKLYIIS